MTPLERPGWKTSLNWLAALLLAALFLASGVWKVTDPHAAAMRMAQARVPESLSLAAALLFGIAETFAAALILTPRYRRWGSALAALMLVAFMVYFAIEYDALRGADCSCFPWLKRVVGPGFFIGDGLMLALAVVAAAWARPSGSIRGAALMLGVVSVFALVSYGVSAARLTGARAPETVTVAGAPYSIRDGKVFFFFFNPECLHCLEAARRMSQATWNGARVVAVPVEQPQYADTFLKTSGLSAVVTTDFAKLKDIFHYTTYPWGMAVENGQARQAVAQFDGDEPLTTLKSLGFVK